MANDEQEVAIVIKGKNLTPEAFTAARRELAGLGEETEKVRQKTKPATEQTNLFSQSWKQLTAGLVAADLLSDAARGLMSMAQESFKAAGQLVDLKTKTGLSLEFLQRLGHVATQSGSDLNTYADVVYKMGLNIAKGGQDTKDAVAKMGMSWEEFKRLSPEKQFEAIAKNIDFTSNVQERNATVTAIAGKGVSNVIVGLVDNYRELRDEAVVATDAQILAIDRLSDRVDKLASDFGGLVMGTMGSFITSIDEATSSGTSFAEFLSVAQTRGIAAALQLAAMSNEAKQVAASTKAATVETETAAKVYRDWSAELTASERAVRQLSAERIREIETAKRAGASVEELTEQYGLSAIELKMLDERLRDEQNAHKSATAEREKATKALRDMADVLTGKKLAEEVKDIAAAVELSGGASKITGPELEKLGKRLADMTAAGAKLPPELAAIERGYQQLQAKSLPVVTTQQSIAMAFAAVTVNGGQALGTLEGMAKWADDVQAFQPYQFLDGVKGMVTTIAGLGNEAPAKFSANFGAMLQTELPKSIMGAVQGGGSVFEAGGSTIGSFLVSEKGFGKTLTEGAKSLFGPQLGGAIATALPGIGAAVGPVLNAVMGKLFGSAGRDAVKEFASNMGGFDALREKLLPLGDEGERLWRNLTQGVGKNNPQQAKAAIDAITKALDEQEEAIRRQEAAISRYNILWYELGETARNAKLNDLIEDLVQEQEDLVAAGVPVETALRRQAGAYNNLIAEALRGGVEIPASLLPTIQRLAEMGEITEANTRALLGMAVDTGTPIDQMRQAADDLGISYEHLGDRFRRMDLEEQGNRYAAAFAKLVDGSADASVIVDKMSEDSKKAINEYLRMGAEVPEAWRPLLEAMQEQGQLTDENGEKLKDLSGIKFAKPLTESMGELVDKIAELIAKLAGEDGLMGSIGKLPREIDIDFNFNGRKSGEWPGSEEGKGGGFESPAFASGGIAEGPMYARIERGRKEIIGDVDFMARALDGALQRRGMAGVAGAGGGQPMTVTIPIYLGNELLDERVIAVANKGLQTQRIQVPASTIARRTRV